VRHTHVSARTIRVRLAFSIENLTLPPSPAIRPVDDQRTSITASATSHHDASNVGTGIIEPHRQGGRETDVGRSPIARERWSPCSVFTSLISKESR
jgi:hypothetical protein